MRRFKRALSYSAIFIAATQMPSVYASELASADQACLQLPAQNFEFDSLDKKVMRTFIPDLRYIINPQNLSITSNQAGESTLRQRFIPSEKGSERVIGTINLQEQQAYTLTQTILFEDNFDWGGEIESGMAGFGLAGGSAPAGGEAEFDRFTVRLLWKGNNDGTAKLGAYVYATERVQNPPFGDKYFFNHWRIPVGEPFTISVTVIMNSTLSKSDGALSIDINDNNVFRKNGISWQKSGNKPIIDQMLYSGFHGGNNAKWSPDTTTFAQFSNVCLDPLKN